jgi:TRAP-type mannitol/chloroaromatic compound transport system permease small subunit
MMRTLSSTALRLIDSISGMLGVFAVLCLVALIGAMVVEVLARHLLGQPTQWAFDVSSMASGMLFVTAAGIALRERQHIMVDFLHIRLSPPYAHGSHLLLFLLLLLPAVTVLSAAGVADTWVAYERHETTKLSPMAMPVWPYYAAITLGLIVLALQAVAQALRHALGLFDSLSWVKPAVPVLAE